MNFFERIRKGRLFFSVNKAPGRNKMPGVNRPRGFDKKPGINLPEQIIQFTFMEQSYILEEFNISFQQEINAKGRPDGLPSGGIIDLTFAGAPDYYINEWMLREELRRDGEIRFLAGNVKVTSGAELIILFEDAYCVDYKKHIHTLKGGLFTSLKISPRTVKIGKEEFTNNWKKEEALPYYIRSGKKE